MSVYVGACEWKGGMDIDQALTCPSQGRARELDQRPVGTSVNHKSGAVRDWVCLLSSELHVLGTGVS